MPEIEVIILLVASGILVGFINTLAGSGTVISIAVLTYLGLPVQVANGTHRIAVMMQNFVAVRSAHKRKIISLKKGLEYGIPTTAGSIIGALFATSINDELFGKIIGVVMVIFLFSMFIKPDRWLKGNLRLQEKKSGWLLYLLYFLMGLYGGFVHIGVGIFMLFTLVLGSGYDLVKANAYKNLLVFMYVPFALGIYIYSGMVHFVFGFTHGLGNMLGAWIATRFAFAWGAKFVRWVLVVVMLAAALHFWGLF